jgi:hypothetical protein
VNRGDGQAPAIAGLASTPVPSGRRRGATEYLHVGFIEEKTSEERPPGSRKKYKERNITKIEALHGGRVRNFGFLIAQQN